ncbi:Nif3-like dinuclear metal center hexameric protein [Thiomicrorhabdus arctica]|uniref:Nif3-like dinuclear metal center hexameric protein n=1 Tax=Thiomicrorhabdus arctica TaxID=131540 RepID=UPI00035E973C|nr:YqfO family protein [Thiomicrorhabdus arctica]
MYKICFYVPESHLDCVKDALFAAGAGQIGQYDCCAWQSKGEGQFRALDGSKPFLGELNQLEKIVEYKVELVCASQYIELAVQALKASHPFETPAYDVIEVLNL